MAAFIGAGGFGERIVAGLAVNDSRVMLAGALPAAALALLVQGAFDLAERWSRRGRAALSDAPRASGAPALAATIARCISTGWSLRFSQFSSSSLSGSLCAGRPSIRALERQARELRDEVQRSAQGTRQELGATLGEFQRTLLAQQNDTARTQNEQIDSFQPPAAAIQQHLAESLGATTLAQVEQARLARDSLDATQSAQGLRQAASLKELSDSLGEQLQALVAPTTSAWPRSRRPSRRGWRRSRPTTRRSSSRSAPPSTRSCTRRSSSASARASARSPSGSSRSIAASARCRSWRATSARSAAC